MIPPELAAIGLLALISLGTGWLAVQTGSPVAAILNRWARWIFIATVVALGLALAGAERPFWVLFVTGFLGWFLFESGFAWAAIGNLSHSDVPLFPRYEEVEGPGEWPGQPRHIRLREWLRRKGFERVRALRAEIGETLVLRTSVFEAREREVRAQVLFIPHRGDALTACTVFSSLGADGSRLITDNYFLPYGGFYPEDWSLRRRPWTRSIARLYRLHCRRMEDSGWDFVPWDIDPLEEVDRQQRLLEDTNTRRGFLAEPALRAEEGRITWEGRYRVWLELWLLSYFGLPLGVGK